MVTKFYVHKDRCHDLLSVLINFCRNKMNRFKISHMTRTEISDDPTLYSHQCNYIPLSWTTEKVMQFTLCAHCCLTFSGVGSFKICWIYWASRGTSATFKWFFQCLCWSHKARFDGSCALSNKMKPNVLLIQQ